MPGALIDAFPFPKYCHGTAVQLYSLSILYTRWRSGKAGEDRDRQTLAGRSAWKAHLEDDRV